MSKPIISVTVYQVGNIVHNPPITIGVPINSKTVVTPVKHPSPDWLAMVGVDGQAPDPSIAPYVYGCIAVPLASNAGVTSYFVAQTVAQIIADVNS